MLGLWAVAVLTHCDPDDPSGGFELTRRAAVRARKAYRLCVDWRDDLAGDFDGASALVAVEREKNILGHNPYMLPDKTAGRGTLVGSAASRCDRALARARLTGRGVAVRGS